jgi:hypothetical protein
VHESYFIPEATPLNTQLLNFQSQRRRIGMVVDEYGDIQGLVTLDGYQPVTGRLPHRNRANRLQHSKNHTHRPYTAQNNRQNSEFPLIKQLMSRNLHKKCTRA